MIKGLNRLIHPSIISEEGSPDISNMFPINGNPGLLGVRKGREFQDDYGESGNINSVVFLRLPNGARRYFIHDSQGNISDHDYGDTGASILNRQGTGYVFPNTSPFPPGVGGDRAGYFSVSFIKISGSGTIAEEDTSTNDPVPVTGTRILFFTPFYSNTRSGGSTSLNTTFGYLLDGVKVPLGTFTDAGSIYDDGIWFNVDSTSKPHFFTRIEATGTITGLYIDGTYSLSGGSGYINAGLEGIAVA